MPKFKSVWLSIQPLERDRQTHTHTLTDDAKTITSVTDEGCKNIPNLPRGICKQKLVALPLGPMSHPVCNRLKSDRLLPCYYPYMPPDYGHTEGGGNILVHRNLRALLKHLEDTLESCRPATRQVPFHAIPLLSLTNLLWNVILVWCVRHTVLS